MTRLDTAIQSLVQGVSQQSRRDRLPGQGVRQENISPDVVFGLRPRPSTTYKTSLLASTAAITIETVIVEGSLFHLFIQDGDIQVFDRDGLNVPVTIDPEVDTSYLAGGQMIARAVDDSVILINKEVTPELNKTEVPQWRTEDKTVQFLGGNFGIQYTLTVRVGDTIVTELIYETPDGSDQEHLHYVTARAISRVFFRALRDNAPSGTRIKAFQTTGADAGAPKTDGTFNRSWVNAAIGFNEAGLIDHPQDTGGVFGNNFKVFWAEDTLLFTTNTTGNPVWDYEVQVNDSFGALTIATVGTSISALNQLTKFGSNGQVTRVIGESENGTDFFMRFSLVSESNLGTDDWMRGTSISGNLNNNASTSGDQGSPDNDQLVGTIGNSDNAFFSRNRVNYNIYRIPGRADWIIIQDNRNAGGDDHGADVVNQNVETLNFADESGTWASYEAEAEDLPEDFLDSAVDYNEDPERDFGKRGIWVEATAPYEFHTFDLNTMPIILSYDSEAEEFSLKRGNWLRRRAGDNASNPPPEFVGRKIQAAQVFQSRLTLLAGPYVMMSRTGKSLDFWNQSASFSADDDPITVTSTARRSAVMRSLVPHNRDLIVFSDNAQFFVAGRTAVTPSNAGLSLTTTYSSDSTAEPASTGNNVVFGAKNGGFMEMYEFFVQGDTAENVARTVTGHVTRYIKGLAQQIEVSNNNNLVLVRTDDDPKVLYAYDYMWIESERIQSAWSKWVMPYDVVHVHFEQDELSIIFFDGEEYFLATAGLDRGDDPDIGYELCMDLIQEIEVEESELVTTIPLISTEDIFVIQGSGCPNPGTRATITQRVDQSITLREDMQGGRVFVGHRMPRIWEPTMPVMRDQNGIAIGTGSFVVDTFFLNFQRTGQISVDISSGFRDTSAVEFDGRFLGGAQAIIGTPGIADGVLEIPFYEDPDLATFTVSSDDPRPFYIVDLEYASNFVKRGRRT